MPQLPKLEQHASNQWCVGRIGVATAHLFWMAVTTLVLTALLIAWLRPQLLAWNMVDVPEQRRQHSQPTPRGAGLAMAVVLAVMLWLTWWVGVFPLAWVASLWLLVVGVSTLGGLEDQLGLSVTVRLLAQFILAIVSLALMGLAFAEPLLWLLCLVLVWSMNLHNFMDGSDGLTGLQGAWVGVVLTLWYVGQGDSWGASVGILLAGACAGFLLWNWPPARVFMGDSGSLMIGAVVGWLLIWGHVNMSLPWWLAALSVSVFVTDTTVTLLFRLFRRAQWYTAHHDHAYQRLIAMGASHGQVLMGFAAIKLAFIAPVTLAIWAQQVNPVLAVGGVYALLILAWVGVQYHAQRN